MSGEYFPRYECEIYFTLTIHFILTIYLLLFIDKITFSDIVAYLAKTIKNLSSDDVSSWFVRVSKFIPGNFMRSIIHPLIIHSMIIYSKDNSSEDISMDNASHDNLSDDFSCKNISFHS